MYFKVLFFFSFEFLWLYMQQFRIALRPVRRLYFVISKLNPDLPRFVQWKEMAFMLHIFYFIADATSETKTFS